MPESSTHPDHGHTYPNTTLGSGATVIFGNVNNPNPKYGNKMLFRLKIISGIVGVIVLVMLVLNYLYFPWSAQATKHRPVKIILIYQVG